MADIKLVRPSAGQTAVIPSAPDARMVLDFSADQVSIERPQGSDSLFFRFDDGAAIELQNFYTQYNKDDIPSFEVDGQLIAGADFFNAFGPDLAPAAGPSASPTRSGRYSDFANAGLEDGVNHLDGLDYRLGFGGDTQPNINPYASPFLTNAAPTLSTGGAAIAIGLTESAWDGKTASAAPVVSQSGSFSVADPDGDSLTTTVSMGGKVVAVSTAGPTTVESDYGTLVITPSGGGSNITFTYTYTLKQDPDSPTDSLAQGEKQADNIVFSINDGQGHTVTQPINVVITGSNDAPDITGVGSTLTLKEGGVYADQPVGDKLHADELNGAPGVQATLSGTITAHDPDHGAQLYFGLKDVNGNLLDMTSVNADGTLKGTFVIGSVNNPDHTASDVVVTGIAEQGGQIVISTNYGDLVLGKTSDTTATYTFTLKNADGEGATNKLAEGQQVSLKFEPYVRDEHGAEDGNSSTLRDGTAAGNAIVINILGTNDAPTITQNAWNGQSGSTALSATLTEASDSTAQSSVTGTIIGHDVDNGDSLHYGLIQPGSDTMHGKVYVVLASDGHTLTTTTDASTAATAKNYVGEFTLTEDADPTKGASYKFTLYNDSPAVQGMQAGDSQDVSIGLVARDSFGAYVQESVSVTVKGANDTPVITTAPTLAALSVVELGVKNVHGDPNEAFAGTSKDADSGHSFTVTDVDNNDTQAVSIAVKELPGAAFKDNHDGTYTVTTPEGTFTLTAGAAVANDSGSSKTYTYSYELNNSASETQALHEGETRNYTFTVTVTDSKGAHVDQAVSLTITGTNDQPQLTITPGDSGTLKEDAATTTSAGTWAVADPDNDGSSQTLSIAGMGQTASGAMNVSSHTGNPVSVATDYGTLTLKSDGTYTYELDNSKPAVQKLGEGQSHTESFTVTTTDIHGANHSQAITVVINGTNDNPVIGSSVIAVDVIEKGVQGSHDPAHSNDLFNGTVAAQGYVTATDVDDNDNSGGKPALTFSVAAGTGTTVDTHGANSATTVTTSYGTLVIDPKTGAYTYTLDNTKADALNENQKVTETFVVKVADGHGGSVTQPITVTITGTNDRPDLSLAAPSASSFKEDSGSYQASGTFTVADADADGAFKEHTGSAANHSYIITSGTKGTASVDPGTGVATYTTKYGVLTVNPDGTYKYDVTNNSNAVQNLREGQTHTETFQITVKDLHGSTDTKPLTFKITGTNDQALIDKTSGTLTVKEAGVVSLTDRAHTDSDSSIPGYNNVAASGSKLNNGSDAVSAGSFKVTDMDTTDVLKATLSSTSGVDLRGISTMSGAGTWTVNDTYGTLTVTGVRKVNSNGSESITYSYSYAVDQSKTESLAQDQTKTLDYKITVTDSHGTPVEHNITINVQGTNDAPSVTGQTLTLKDDGRLDGGNAQMPSGTGDPAAHGNSYKDSVEGALTGKDSDTGATLTYGLITATSGANAYKHLGTDSGELSTGTVAGTVLKDGALPSDTPASLSADMVASTGAYPGTGGGNATVISVYAAGQPHTADNLYGTLYLNETTGQYTFTLATGSSVVNALGSGDTLTLNFQAVAVDEHNASSTAITIPIVIYGTNDKPVLTLTDSSLEVTDGGPVSDTALAGSVKVTDADVNDSHTFGIVSNSVTETGNTPAMTSTAAGHYGTLSINPQTGEYTYTLAKNNAAVISLDKGETLPETFQVAVVDKYGAYSLQTITVTINGKDDPTIINTGWVTPSNAVVESGVNPITSAAAAASAAKMDDGSAGVRTATGYIGAHDADTSDNTALASAAESAKLHYVIQVGGKDCDLNALMAGTGVQTGIAAIDLDTGKLTLTGGSASTLGVGQAAKDADGNIVIKLENGSLTISKDTSHTDANGTSVFKYVYTVDNTDADVQEKNFHEHTEDNFSVVVHDTTTHTDVVTAPVTIRIEGANDRPIITQAPAVTLSESDVDSTTGRIQLLDYEQTGGTAQTVSSGFTFSLVGSADATSGDCPVMQGLYGRLVLNQASGEYTYYRTADLTALNDDGKQLTETFYVRVQDKDGAYSEVKAITVAIAGEDSKGVLHDNAISVKEDGVSGTVHGVLHYTAADKLGANAVQPLLPTSGVVSGKLSVADADINVDSSGHTLVGGGTGDTYTKYSYGAASATLGKIDLSCSLVSSTVVNGIVTDATYSIAGYGTVSVHSNGSYDFTAAKNGTELSPALNSLAEGESVTIKIPATTHSNADGSETVNGTVSITINGTNDAPVVSINASGLSGSGLTTLQSTDAAISMLVSDSGLISEFIHTYVPDSLQDITDWLAQHMDHVGLLDELLKIWPGAGSKASEFLTAKYGSALLVDTEIAKWSGSKGGDLVVDGNLHNAAIVTDVDNGSSLKFFAIEDGKAEGNLVQQIEGTYGTLVIQQDGSYQYVLDRNSENYQNLCKHDPKGTSTETFTVYVRDEHNAVAAQPITLVINVAATSGGGSGGGHSAQDVVLGSGVVASVYEDGIDHGNPAAMTVTGSVAQDIGNTKYDSDIFLSGKYDTKGSDGSTATHAAGRATSIVTTSYGTLTLLPDGSYTFTLNNDYPEVQALRDGDTITQTFEVTNTNNKTANNSSITILIHGTNDAPYVVSQNDTVAFHQEAGSSIWHADDAAGAFTVADVDKGEAASLTLVGATAAPSGAAYDYTVKGSLGGTFFIKNAGTGSYTYTYEGPDGVYRGTGTDTATLTVADPRNAGTTVTLSAALSAANNAPTNLTAASGSDLDVQEDGGSAGLVASGKLVATDSDISLGNQSVDQNGLSYAIENSGSMAQGTYGTLILDADGTYSYHLNNSLASVQSLGATGKVYDVFTVVVSDGHGGSTTAQLSVAVNGVNDAPVITLHADGSSVAGSGAALFVADGQANLTVGGTAVTYDVDAGDSLTLKLNGQAIASGSTSVTEDVYAYKDASGWHVGTSASSGAVLMGLLELNKDGTYNFQGDKGGIAHLAQGETLTIDARIGVSDAAGATDTAKVAVTITGTNDSPKMEAFNADATTLTDNGASVQTLSGTITATDVDGDTLTYYIKSGGKYVTELHDGHGTLKLDGKNYTYTLDAAYAKSLEAQGKDVTTEGGAFTVVTVDKYGVETSQTLAITLKGVNNDPTFTAPSLSIVEGASPLTGNLGAVDVDTNDAVTYSLAYGTSSATASGATNAVVEGHYGQLTLDASGNYKYTLTNHELAQGAKATETFTVTVKDGQGGTVSHDVVVNITGTNDAPVAHLDASSHALSATDVDLGDHLAFSVNGHELNAVPQGTTEVHGAFGTLTFTADETHKDKFSYGDYKLDSSYDSISKLAALHDAGSDLKDTFGYTVSDGHSTNGQASGTISVDINTDNWDGQGGHLLFAQENSSTHAYEAAGGAGSDILIGGSHDDILYGGGGDDILYGGAGHNDLYGGEGNDTLYAGNAGDHLYGDAGNDHLYGGAGNDFLDGGANTFATDGGGNHLYGGAGNDVLVFHQGDTIDGGSGTDMLLVKGGSVDALFDSDGKLNSNISNTEILISGKENGTVESLTDVGKLSDIGMTVGSDGKVTTANTSNATWADSGTHGDYNVMTCTITHTDSSSEEVTVAVLKTTLNNG